MSQTPTIVNVRERFDLVVNEIESRKNALEPLLPEHLSWAGSVALLKAALVDTPGLVECDKLSIYTSLERAFKLGLEPNGPLQEGWLLPYRETKTGQMHAQWIIGYKGWLKLAWQSGKVKQPHAAVVYRQEVEAGLVEIHDEPPKIVHKRDLLMDRSGWTDDDIVASYFRMPLKGGGVVQAVLSRADLDKKEKLSKTKSGWRSDARWPNRYAGMARKAAILDAFNKREAPISTEQLALALQNEREAEALVPVEADIIEKPKPQAPQITGSEKFTPREEPKPDDAAKGETVEMPAPMQMPDEFAGQSDIPF
ncbi:MAG: recombinase RecT [Planctomycetota bacterium]